MSIKKKITSSFTKKKKSNHCQPTPQGKKKPNCPNKAKDK